MSQSNEFHLETLLDNLTDAILSSESHDLSKLLEQVDLPKDKINGLLDLICQLKNTLIANQPSDQFVQELKHELVGHRKTILAHVRYLPGRVQIAAGLAVVAGFILITRRRLLNETQDGVEVPALQQ